MALIKSALEIALERTKDMKADPAALKAFELKQEGQRLAGNSSPIPPRSTWKPGSSAVPKEDRGILRQAVFGVLAARIQLPLTKAGMSPKPSRPWPRGFPPLASPPSRTSGSAASLKQIEDFLARYLEDAIQPGRGTSQAVRPQAPA
ncbi:MAG: hypothetical protein MZV70_69590 [Desulfobacterales bacterium]|nr:hypothetical protein [Desulfobacterales bacterium]